MCNNCTHRPVCHIHRATGGVNNCEHYREDRKGVWEDIQDFGGGNCYGYCSNCHTHQRAQNATALKLGHKYCRWCGADMRGNENE